MARAAAVLGETFGADGVRRGWARRPTPLVRPVPFGVSLEAFLVSAGTITIGEVGDKTQLLALLLATRFRKPLPIILGILLATGLNHLAAGLAGEWIDTAVPPEIMRWALGFSFLAMATWALVPDKADDQPRTWERFGAFGASTVAFFLLEIGDKTQLATVALAAKYHALLPVVAGTTLGMMLADVPAVFFGEALAKRLSLRVIRWIAATILGALGIGVLLGIARLVGG